MNILYGYKKKVQTKPDLNHYPDMAHTRILLGISNILL
jgi:hypothetical protein